MAPESCARGTVPPYLPHSLSLPENALALVVQETENEEEHKKIRIARANLGHSRRERNKLQILPNAHQVAPPLVQLINLDIF